LGQLDRTKIKQIISSYIKKEKKIGLKLKTEVSLKTSLIYQIIKDIEYIYLV